MIFPQEFAERSLWIPVNADKTPRKGSSIKPVGTLSDIESSGALRGFCFSEALGLVGIDLDDCLDSVINEYSPLATQIISLLPTNSYIERSLSGAGLHIIGTSSLPLIGWRNRKGIEMYNHGRYFIITGDIIGEYSGGPFTDITVAVRYLLDTYAIIQPITNGYHDSSVDDLERIATALSVLDPDADYTTWSRYGLAMGNSFKATPLREDAIKVFANWSARSKKFNAAAKRSITSYFDPSTGVPANGLTIASIFADAPAVLEAEKKSINVALLDDIDEEEEECTTASHGGTGGDVPPEDDVPHGTTARTPLSYVLHPLQVAEAFLSSTHCFHVSGKSYHLWGGKHWKLDRSPILVLRLLKEFIFVNGYNMIPVKGGGMVPTSNPKTKDLNEVLKHVEILSAREEMTRPNSWFDAERRRQDPYVVAVRQGLLSITKGCIVSELTPAFYNTGVLPCEWDAEATCPRFLEGLSLTFAGDNTPEDVEDNIRALQLWFGYLFLIGRNEKRIAVLLGDADSGKSTLLRIMELLVGKDYYKAISAGSLEGKRTDFGGGFDTNFLGGYDEFPFDKKMNALGEILKLCTGGARIEQRKLYSEASTVEVLMRFVFTSNVSPDYFSDPKGGLMKRLLIWRCSAVPRERLDPAYLDVLEKEELPGILRWAVEGAQALLAGGKLRQAGGASQLLHDDFRDSTRGFLEQWVEARFVEDPEGMVTNDTLQAELTHDRTESEWRSMHRWLDEKFWANKTLLTKLHQAIKGCVFPAAKTFKNNNIRGLKGIRLRKKGDVL